MRISGEPEKPAEKQQASKGERVSLDRRSYLKAAGLLAAPLGLGQAEGATTDEGAGYGEGGYGEGTYGGTTSEPALTVEVSDATSITSTTATLTGAVNDLGNASSVTVYFEWWESGTNTVKTTGQQTVSATGSISAALETLSANTTYEFRAVAEASDGDTATTGTRSFTTATEPNVAITTESPTDVTATSVTLHGTVADLGGATSADVVFEWGPVGEGFPQTTSSRTLTATGTVNASLSGLASDTTYEYRAVVTASDGDSDTGQTRTVTTQATVSPTIDRYVVTEAGSPNPHAKITADWAVSDADGDLTAARIEVLNSRGTVLKSTPIAISGSHASQTTTITLKHTGGQSFVVRLTATDTSGNTATQSMSVTS